jgi:hypothetical protein
LKLSAAKSICVAAKITQKKMAHLSTSLSQHHSC